MLSQTLFNISDSAGRLTKHLMTMRGAPDAFTARMLKVPHKEGRIANMRRISLEPLQKLVFFTSSKAGDLGIWVADREGRRHARANDRGV